jgi:L-alanine-DL-glutamate epimerase-like enolase superfamily enzyme
MRNWGVNSAEQDPGPYEDLRAFLTDAGALAESLLAQGFGAMKIWPFDLYVETGGGEYITKRELRAGLEPFQRIREAVGDDMEIMVELHSLWNLPSAIRIAKALESIEPAWYEDPIKVDDLEALRRFSAATDVPTAVSETLGTRWSFRDLIERGDPGIVIFDPGWVGGVTESKAICSLAAAHRLPVAPHDCAGPVEFAVAVHLTINAPNAFVQEMVRAFYHGWYRELVSELPRVENGFVFPLDGPGIGTDLRPEVYERPDARIETSALDERGEGSARGSSRAAGSAPRRRRSARAPGSRPGSAP